MALSDARLQFLLLDRTTFKQFAGLQSIDQAPGQKTLWKSRDWLEKAGCIEELVTVFKEQLAADGYELQTGTIVDSPLVQCHRQRNTRAGNGAGVGTRAVPKPPNPARNMPVRPPFFSLPKN